jgi:hypothetical protein
LFPPALTVLDSVFACSIEDIRRCGFEFLKSVSLQFRRKAVPIVQRYLPFLQSSLAGSRDSALLASAIYTGYSLDLTLLGPVCDEICNLLRDGQYDGQKDALAALTRLASALSGSSSAPSLFDLVISAVETVTEPEILESAFESLRRVFKFCHRDDPSFFLERSVQVVARVTAGDIKFMGGRPAAACPALAPLVQPFMEFLGDIFAADPAGVGPVCESLLGWLATVKESDRFAVLGALSDAVEHCAVEERIVADLCGHIFANWKVFTDPDMQHNVASLMAVLVRKGQLQIAREALPIIAEWWRYGLCKKAGWEEMLANCASFFLTLAAADQDAVDDALAVAAMEKFPPVQSGETVNMAEALLAVAQRDDRPVRAAAAAAIARILTEEESVRERRKIPDVLMERIIDAFRIIMQEKSVRDPIVAAYRRKRAKVTVLLKIIE